MSDTYEITLTVKKNGSPIPGLSPLVKRHTCDQSQTVNYLQVSGGGALALPIAQITDLTLLLVQGSTQETLTLGAITLYGGGLVLLLNATPASETLTNASGENATNSVLAGGT